MKTLNVLGDIGKDKVAETAGSIAGSALGSLTGPVGVAIGGTAGKIAGAIVSDIGDVFGGGDSMSTKASKKLASNFQTNISGFSDTKTYTENELKEIWSLYKGYEKAQASIGKDTRAEGLVFLKRFWANILFNLSRANYKNIFNILGFTASDIPKIKASLFSGWSVSENARKAYKGQANPTTGFETEIKTGFGQETEKTPALKTPVFKAGVLSFSSSEPVTKKALIRTEENKLNVPVIAGIGAGVVAVLGSLIYFLGKGKKNKKGKK